MYVKNVAQPLKYLNKKKRERNRTAPIFNFRFVYPITDFHLQLPRNEATAAIYLS